MSLVTRCPDCSTAFRASQRQLSARAGMVRCGRCGRVFDAFTAIVDELSDPPAEPPVALAAARQTLVAAVAAIEAKAGKRADGRQSGTGQTGTEEVRNDETHRDETHRDETHRDETHRDETHRDEVHREETRQHDFHREGTPHDASPADESLESETGDGETLQVVPSASEPELALPLAGADASSPEDASSPDESATPAEIDFGPPPRTRRSWLWWPACLLALVALAAQGAFYYRGEVSLLLPEAKTAVKTLCADLGCEVPLPRRGDLTTIESHDLQADGSNPSVMVLSATLRNRAAYAQALPAIELTLTNSQDQLVARRVLMPRDYAPRGTETGAEFGGNSELSFKVYIEAAALKATGYRLYPFYPPLYPW